MMTNMGNERLRHRRHNRSGSTLVLIAVCGVVLFAMTGLAVDGGYVYLTANQLQNAADAAALAGAAALIQNGTAASDKAKAIAGVNFAAGQAVALADGDVLVGRYNRTSGVFSTGVTPYNAVMVTARKTDLKLMFGPVVGVNTANVQKSSIAMMSGNFGAGVIVLNNTVPDALSIAGSSGSLTVTNSGAIIVDSNNAQAIYTNGTGGQVHADDVYVVGGWPDSSGYTGSINRLSAPIGDPIYNSGLRAPNPLDYPNQGGKYSDGTPLTIQEGYYPNGLPQAPHNGVLKLGPGVFIVGGKQNLGAVELLADQGTMICLLDGYVDIKGTEKVKIVAPTSGTYQGISIWQVTPDTTRGFSKMQGGSGVDVTGTVYIPNGTLEMGGNPTCFGNQLIVNQLHINGAVKVTVDYDGSFPIPGGKAFLVK